MKLEGSGAVSKGDRPGIPGLGNADDGSSWGRGSPAPAGGNMCEGGRNRSVDLAPIPGALTVFSGFCFAWWW